MALKYLALALIFSVTISLTYANAAQDAYNFLKEVCEATQDGENQDGPCVKELEKLILGNNRKDNKTTKKDPFVKRNTHKTFEDLAFSCSARSASGGTRFQRICNYIRQGKATEEEKAACALGYGFQRRLVKDQVVKTFRETFQNCLKQN